ncbi:MAG: type I secretion system permease/ATPase [Hyphomicrobiaceae bacterium]
MLPKVRSIVSRPTSTSAAEASRVEYTGADDLDRVLVHLRRVKEESEASKKQRRQLRSRGGASAEAAPDPTEKIVIPETPVVAADTPIVPSPFPASSPAAPADGMAAAAAKAASALHASTARKAAPASDAIPETAVDRLATFVAGSTAAPTPVTAGLQSAKPERLSVISSRTELGRAIAASRDAFVAIGLFSMVINVLMLTGPIFMLQVYDRVMASGSMSTLLALSILTAGLYGIIGLLEWVRSRVIVRVGIDLDRRVGDRIFQAALQRCIKGQNGSMVALRELDSMRQFIAGPGPITFFDAPWTPIYLIVVFLLHWTLGLASVFGAALLLAIAWASEVRSRGPLLQAGKAQGKSLELAETAQRNAEAITAMGMLGAYRGRWQKANGESLAWQVLAADRLASLSSASKALRLLLQSMMLAIGAALAIKGDISAGSIVAATIIFGRALAPVEQAIAQWRSFGKARDSYQKLDKLLADHPAGVERTSLPKPAGHLEVANLRVAAPETKTVILANINFTVAPGRMLAVIGPSASGKSTLARALVGIWEPFGGSVRLDGARLDQWSGEELGRHIGYLPQDCELFAGTVRENISRFREDATDDEVVEAAKAAHAHELIMALPQSYETELGAFGTFLSAGQRQRIGLARALYGHPALIVLDEPNANLDRVGDEALSAAIDGMRARGQAVVLISHRVQAIGKADDLLYIERGVQRAFGPRAEVIRFLQSGAQGAGPNGAAVPPTPGATSAPPPTAS